jgi:hypothetical protein
VGFTVGLFFLSLFDVHTFIYVIARHVFASENWYAGKAEYGIFNYEL